MTGTRKDAKLGLIHSIAVAFLFFIFMVSAAHGQSMRAIQVTEDNVKRSSIHEVDGYAYLSEDMTLAETRAAALTNAKRQAVEMAKTKIKSQTKVENFVVVSDEIEGSAEGAVTILEQKDLGVEENTRYHIWIRAEVEYGLNQTVAAKQPEMVMDPEAPLTVKVWTSKKSYKAGEQIEIYVQGNRDFYGRIVDITAGGQIVQLLPNDYRTNNFFKGGKVHKIPDAGDRFDLTATPPFGEDQIIVYASDAPLGNVDMESVGGGLKLYSGDQRSFAAKTRGISVSSAGKKPSEGTEFYEAVWEVNTVQ